METHKQIQYRRTQNSQTIIGTVIDCTKHKIVVTPIADTTGTPITTTITHQIPRDPELYRIIA